MIVTRKKTIPTIKILCLEEVEVKIFSNDVARHRNDPTLSPKETRKLILGYNSRQ